MSILNSKGIDLKTETTISLVQAARMQPPGRRGRPVTLSCVLRWILKGCRGPDGEMVRLEGVRIGGRWITSIEALERFAARLTPNLVNPPATPRSPSRRQRASERAAAALERIGI
jgi:hypothetical protein